MWIEKLAAVALGAGIAAGGFWFMACGSGLTVALNRMYVQLPGKFQYPPRFHLFFGAALVGFGALITVAGVLLAGR